ncbi:MAG: exodeoxyribonuclease VII small subunit [Erysipelotrichaceae bacterium]
MEKKSFKSSMSRLTEIVSALEKNEIELEEALTLFEEGLQLVTSCDSQLKQFEEKITTLSATYKIEETNE